MAKCHRGTAGVTAELREELADTAQQGLELRTAPSTTRGQGPADSVWFNFKLRPPAQLPLHFMSIPHCV